ncbi:MAG TPA: hypothetical protein VK308_14710 [Pyrinomonadaceae bacterium]|nr:hypothetical protein [Pyrinomonadaceae bacterium]
MLSRAVTRKFIVREIEGSRSPVTQVSFGAQTYPLVEPLVGAKGSVPV